MLPEETGRSPPLELPRSSQLRPWRMVMEWAIIALICSGGAWLVARYLFATETEFGSLMPSWASRVLAIHGGLAMLSLLAFGAWLPLHAVPRLRGRDGLVTGVAQLALLAVLTATGYGLYYLAEESSRPTWSAVHWICGLVLPLVLLLHRWPVHPDMRK